ncbi:Ff.00g107310.m01.CDS01 [Fusarium sp. VM40]|nr:Ff.00g107310.m01.CDS01 [Fusarium sp. VM40]
MASSDGDVRSLEIPEKTTPDVPDSLVKTFNTRSYFALLWKMCLHILHISPYSLFSPLRKLHADTSLTYYNETFSQELCRLITHGAIAGNRKRLTLLLQFAVICRTDDRRHWNLPVTHDVEVLQELRKAIATSEDPLPTSIPDMLNDLLLQVLPSPSDEVNSGNLPEGPPYSWSCETLPVLMSHLSCIARESSTDASGPNVTIYQGFDVYSVSTIDLQNIRKAIDIVSIFNSPKSDLSFSVQSYFDKYKSRWPLDDRAPRDRKELKRFIKASYRENYRKIIDAQKLAGR